MSSNDPLHGITLEALLNQLVDHYGWQGMADWIRINCFSSNPSIKSSLTFLRRTPWARAQVEALFIGFKNGESDAEIRQRLKALAAPKASSAPAAKTGAPKVDPWAKHK